MRIVSNIPQAAEAYIKGLEKKADEAVFRALTKTGIAGEAKAKGIIEREAYDTGDLLRSVNSYVIRYPNEMKLVLQASAEQGIFVEEGRKPGKWPNLDALTKWVGRKLREQGVNTKVNVTFDQLKALAKSSKGAQKDAYRMHLSMLYLVGRKIATKGIKGKLIFKRIQSGLLKDFRATLMVEFQAIS
jgi:hypothetical protein